MHTRSLLFVSLFALLLLTSSVTAQETVENPMYKEWAKWREGSSATTKSESHVDGTVQVVTIQTQTLKQLTADKAVIEIKTVTEAAGQKIEAPPLTFEIPARGPKVEVTHQAQEQEQQEVPKYKESKGTETLTIDGKSVKCDWHQIEVEGCVTKTWSSDEVPGRMVKSESKAMGNITLVQLTAFKALKQ